MRLFIWLHQVLVVAHSIFSCGMWDLIWKAPSPGIEPGSALHCERGVLATGPPGKPREPSFMTHTQGSAHDVGLAASWGHSCSPSPSLVCILSAACRGAGVQQTFAEWPKASRLFCEPYSPEGAGSKQKLLVQWFSLNKPKFISIELLVRCQEGCSKPMWKRWKTDLCQLSSQRQGWFHI